jgi:hypothetical protein
MRLHRIASLSCLGDCGPVRALYWARMSDLPESQALYDGIRTIILPARQTVARGVDLLQAHTNYEIGRRTGAAGRGAERAQYGKEILRELAARLTAEFGKGFSRSNLEHMRRFYRYLQIAAPASSPRQRLGNTPRPTRAHNSPLPQMVSLCLPSWSQRTGTRVLRNRGSRAGLDPTRTQASVQLGSLRAPRAQS